METYVLRIWLPDRPGALGAVASRIGAVKGDVVGIEILETGQGQAVDELVVSIPDATLVDLLVNEIRQVDGVNVEEIRPTGGKDHDPRLVGLEASVALVTAETRSQLLTAIDEHAAGVLNASWVALVDPATGDLLRSVGADAPDPDWLLAFVAGARSASELGGGDTGPSDVLWTDLAASGLAFIAGRDRIAWRSRERGHLEALAQIFDARWTEIAA